MDVQGIDQVMIIPTEIDIYPWLRRRARRQGVLPRLQRMGLRVHEGRSGPAVLRRAASRCSTRDYAIAGDPARRRAGLPRRAGPADGRDGQLPAAAEIRAGVGRARRDRHGLRHAPVPGRCGSSKPSGYSEQYSGAELIRRTMATAGVPHSFLTNVQNFQAEAALWVTIVLMSGFFERHPKINAAVFEASSTWLSFLIDECDKAYRLYRNERQLPPLKKLPSETFFEHCMTGFEGDEAPPARLPEFYGDILCWSSDVYHHDGDDAWRAIETMQKYDLPKEDQAKFLGANARRLYKRRRRRRISSASASPRSSARTGGRPTKKSRPRSPPRRRVTPLVNGGRAAMATRLHRVRQRLPRRRTARALGEVPRPRVPHARQARAVASRGRNELLPQGQRRDRAATR